MATKGPWICAAVLALASGALLLLAPGEPLLRLGLYGGALLIYGALLGLFGLRFAVGGLILVLVLSGLAAVDLLISIRKGEVDRLVRIPGVGKKTAERIVLELRDKVPAPGGQEPERSAPAPALTAIDHDVLSALLNLGCARPAAEATVRKAKAAGGVPADFEPMFRRALELLR